MNNLINRLFVESSLYQTTNLQADLQMMCNTLLAMERFISTNPPTIQQKSTWYNSNSKKLFEVAQILRKNAKVRIVNDIQNRKVANMIVAVLDTGFNYSTYTMHILEFINSIYTEFLKGITHFQTNTSVSRPVYHRDQSCGARNALNELNCSKVYNTPDEFTRRSQKVRKCYIERNYIF